MKYDPPKHHRQSIRLSEYDYGQSGDYYITIVTQDRVCLFGDLEDGDVVLNDAGKMIEKWYFELENKFPDIRCDEYVIMPNHFHAIIINVGADLRVCPENCMDATHKKGEQTGSPLPNIVQWFKTMTTNEYIFGVKNKMWTPFDKKNYGNTIIGNMLFVTITN